MRTFRDKDPRRTYSGQAKTNYQDYREQLAEDFNHRCGYTDCRDMWWAGGFNIDHFAPLKPKLKDDATRDAKRALFAAGETDYNNLVYTCPQINRAKSNDWPSDNPATAIVGDIGYYDPCSSFNDYFERTDTGAIIPKDDPVARYMWKRLKLYLKRYEFYWRLDQLFDRMAELNRLSKVTSLPPRDQDEIKEAIVQLSKEFTDYLQYLSGNYTVIAHE